MFYLPISAASLVNDYLPDPPTPTKSPDDLGDYTIRETLIRWFIASSKSTKAIFLAVYFSLYFSSKK
jgi:hypothetical protein